MMLTPTRVPRFVTYYRHGEVLLLLRPRHAGHAPPLGPGDLVDVESTLRGAGLTAGPGGSRLFADPFAGGGDKPRTPLRMTRPTRGELVLQCMNLAGWVRFPERKNPEQNLADFVELRDSIRDVGIAVEALNTNMSGKPVGNDYELVAASPNWLAHPFEGC